MPLLTFMLDFQSAVHQLVQYFSSYCAPGESIRGHVTNKNPKKAANFREILNITGAGEKIKLRTPEAVATRFVLIELTRLPFDGSNYVGGISEVRILG